MSRTPPSGTPAPQWGRGGQDPLGPGNWRGYKGPVDNRPPTVHGVTRSGCRNAAVLILFAFGSAVLGIAGFVAKIGSVA